MYVCRYKAIPTERGVCQAFVTSEIFEVSCLNDEKNDARPVKKQPLSQCICGVKYSLPFKRTYRMVHIMFGKYPITITT